MMLLLFTALRLAVQQLMLSIVTERMLKDLLLLGLQKLAPRTSNTVDDEVLHLVRRALYPELEAAVPYKAKNSKKARKKRKKVLQKPGQLGKL